MTESRLSDGGPIDQAALVIAGLAATITLITTSGPWGPLSIPLGITILLTVLAFYDPPRTSGRDLQALARRGVFASVGGLAICILLGWGLQATVISWSYRDSCVSWARDTADTQSTIDERADDCLAGKTTDSFIIVWPLAAVALSVVDHKLLRSRAVRPDGETSRPVTPSAEKESPA
ncbi:hypothetical protein GCM10023196_056420 [Actinoallomurus vinaceus]|uniref:MFS transporter n=1 Tax=Actinoallomurus vinaceus TaxID=1080074 RepID=A0ABP8UI93_9ACTN